MPCNRRVKKFLDGGEPNGSSGFAETELSRTVGSLGVHVGFAGGLESGVSSGGNPEMKYKVQRRGRFQHQDVPMVK